MKLLKINLKDEAQKLESQLSGHPSSSTTNDFNKLATIRIFHVTNNTVAEKTIREIQNILPKKVIIEKIKRGDTLLDPSPTMTVKLNDLLAIIGDRKHIIAIKNSIGPEADDSMLLALSNQFKKIRVTKFQAEGKTIGEILSSFGQHCFLSAIGSLLFIKS